METAELLVIFLTIALSGLGIWFYLYRKDQEAAKTASQRRIDERTTALQAVERQLSEIKSKLAEAEKERDFYKNIQEASGGLNDPAEKALPDDTPLDIEQLSVCIAMEKNNANFFVTGKAGTGKSFLLSTFRKTTKKRHIVLAPTGVAALNVGGSTIHSAFGYDNLTKLDVNDISISTIKLKSEKKLVLQHVSTIIIDEISMIRADTFDKIDKILKVINKNDKPFGGKQLLLFGDLFQLPPIARKEEWHYLYDRYGGIHFFCSDAYKNADFRFHELTINHRQKEDTEYFDLLNRIREGIFTKEDEHLLNTRVVQDISVYDRFTALLPQKDEVERINKDHIRRLNSQEYLYSARIVVNKYPNSNPPLEKLFPIQRTLRLKKGALVMMVANDPEQRWANGTLGIVSELSRDSISVAINKRIYEIHIAEFSEQEVTYKDGKLEYEDILIVEQYPIVPAYAMTIHKSQGQTYQNIICDLEKCFADGQAYVALSRCTSLNGLHLRSPVRRASIRVDRSVLDFYRANVAIARAREKQNVPNSDTK